MKCEKPGWARAITSSLSEAECLRATPRPRLWHLPPALRWQGPTRSGELLFKVFSIFGFRWLITEFGPLFKCVCSESRPESTSRWESLECVKKLRSWHCYEDRDVHDVWMPSEVEDVGEEEAAPAPAAPAAQAAPAEGKSEEESLEEEVEGPWAARKGERERQKAAKEARQQMRQMAATFDSRRRSTES